MSPPRSQVRVLPGGEWWWSRRRNPLTRPETGRWRSGSARAACRVLFIFATPAPRAWTFGEPCTVRHTGPPMWTTTVDHYLPVQGQPAIFASREPLAGLRTESTRGKPGSPRRQCGRAELPISKRINCGRLPGDREPHRGCAGSYFTIKETNHAIRHSDRPVRPRGRRVRAADGAGVERQGAGKHVSLRLETKERDRSHLYVTYATKRRGTRRKRVRSGDRRLPGGERPR